MPEKRRSGGTEFRLFDSVVPFEVKFRSPLENSEGLLQGFLKGIRLTGDLVRADIFCEPFRDALRI
jgi:hypothetical protein